MNEQDFRATLTKAELEERSYIISVKITDFDLLDRLNKYSVEFEKSWDELINTAIEKFISDIHYVHNLRR